MPTKLVVYSKGNVIFDTTGDHTVRKIRQRESKSKKEIKYSVFERILTLEQVKNNKFWEEILSNAARGSFPLNYSFDGIKNKLKYKNNIKNKNDEIFLSEDTDEKNFIVLKEFFKNRGITEDEEDFDISQLDHIKVETPDWKQNGKIHPSVLFDYIQKMKVRYKLNDIECKRLESKVRIGIITDSFNVKNIVIEDNLISSIRDLEFDTNKRDFKILSKPKIVKNKSIKEDTNEYSISTVSGILNVEVDKKNTDIGKIWKNYIQSRIKKEIYI